jgi:hypothetical protein
MPEGWIGYLLAQYIPGHPPREFKMVRGRSCVTMQPAEGEATAGRRARLDVHARGLVET